MSPALMTPALVSPALKNPAGSRHLVVVGHGMAGARFAEEIRRRDPQAAAVRLTVLGAEAHPAYNRVLLSAVLAGSLTPDAVRLHDPDWAQQHQVTLHTGTPVVGIDRATRTVTLASGEEIGYDALVLATGSRAWLPPVAGLSTPDGRPGEGVAVFRDLDDCHRILELAPPGAHVAVLGGGLLGLEAARGLAGRGRQVTVAHPMGHLMERQLDAGAGRVLARTLAGLGVTVRLDTMATAWEPGHGLTTGDGELLRCDAVVVAAGVRAETWLAQRAGLPVGTGVLVDDRLATADPRVHAIGDCAQHPGTVSGLVQPGWEQAAVLADLLTGADPDARYRGTPAVMRLKARDVDLAALGEVHVDENTVDEDTEDGNAAEVLRFSDPARGRYAKLVLRADRVTGAILLGTPDAAATIVQLYDRGAPAPSDRLALLLGRALPPQSEPVVSPAHLPARAVVCRCNTVTKGQLVTAWRAGAHDVDALAKATRGGTGCGSCRDVLTGICEWLATGEPSSRDPSSEPAEPDEEGAA